MAMAAGAGTEPRPMTREERRNPKLIDPSRRNRIARGSGVQVGDVNALIKQFDMMAPVMKAMAGKGNPALVNEALKARLD